MSLISSAKFGCLFSRRMILSSIRIQKPGFFSTSSNFDVKPYIQKRSLFSKNVLLERIKQQQDAKNSHTNAKNMFEQMKKAVTDQKWSHIYGWPRGAGYWVPIQMSKFIYKFATIIHVPWATYAYYASFFQNVNIITASYSAAIIPPLLLYLFTRKLKNTIDMMYMDESNRFIRVTFFTNFASQKIAIIPVKDIEIVPEHQNDQKSKKFQLNGSTFYFPTKNVVLFDKEKAKLVFKNLDDFVEDSDVAEMIKKQHQ